MRGDLEAACALLSQDIQMVNDSGGRYAAARRPVQGAEHVLRFLTHRMAAWGQNASLSTTSLNHTPSLLLAATPLRPKDPPRVVTLFTFDEDKIHGIYALVHPDKVAPFFADT